LWCSGDITLWRLLPMFQQDSSCLRKVGKLRTLKMKAVCPSETDVCNFVVWRNSPPRALATSLLGLRVHAQLHTQWYTTFGRIPLDQWSSCRRDRYLQTRNKPKERTSMTPAEFEPAIPASQRPQTHASTRAFVHFTLHKWCNCSSYRLYWLSKFAQLEAILFSGRALFFRISTETSNMLTEILCGFPQSI
jgi:hypothetical protein